MLQLFFKAEVYVIIIPKGRSKCYSYSSKAEVKDIIIPKVRRKCYNFS